MNRALTHYSATQTNGGVRNSRDYLGSILASPMWPCACLAITHCQENRSLPPDSKGVCIIGTTLAVGKYQLTSQDQDIPRIYGEGYQDALLMGLFQGVRGIGDLFPLGRTLNLLADVGATVENYRLSQLYRRAETASFFQMPKPPHLTPLFVTGLMTAELLAALGHRIYLHKEILIRLFSPLTS